MKLSFDDRYIGWTKTGAIVDTPIITRPLGLKLNIWYDIASQVIKLVNKLVKESNDKTKTNSTK